MYTIYMYILTTCLYILDLICYILSFIVCVCECVWIFYCVECVNIEMVVLNIFILNIGVVIYARVSVSSVCVLFSVFVFIMVVIHFYYILYHI